MQDGFWTTLIEPKGGTTRNHEMKLGDRGAIRTDAFRGVTARYLQFICRCRPLPNGHIAVATPFKPLSSPTDARRESYEWRRV